MQEQRETGRHRIADLVQQGLDRFKISAKVLRFGIIGIASTLLYAIIALVFAYSTAMPAALASLIAYAICGVFSYLGHRLFSFKSKAPVGKSTASFVVVGMLGYVIGVGVPWVGSDIMGYQPVISIALVCVLIPAMNFVLLNWFVFKETHKIPARESDQSAPVA